MGNVNHGLMTVYVRVLSLAIWIGGFLFQSEGGDGKVLYVWFDAPIGYISSTKEWAQRQGKDWEPYWKDEDSTLVHFIGKDNIVFHCIIFPAMLKAEGSYILPKMSLPMSF